MELEGLCCRRSSVFRVRKTLLLLHFDAFLSWLVVKTGSGVQISTPTHSFLMLFSVFVTYQLQVGRVFKSRQRKKLLNSLCVQAPICACRKKQFVDWSFIHRQQKFPSIQIVLESCFENIERALNHKMNKVLNRWLLSRKIDVANV